MSNTYDLNIDNYNEAELLKLIKYKGDISRITPSDITNHINQLIHSYRNKYKGKHGEDDDDYDYEMIDLFIDFLNKANDKLLSYINLRRPVQLQPTNYNIIQSQNQIQGGTHDVTTDKIIPVVNVNEYKYPTGVINPLEKKTITKIISIDSEFRENYYATSPSDFIWYLPFTEHKVVSIKLVSLELPILWYSVSEKNKSNTFTITTYNIVGSPDTTHTIVMPDGNYLSGDFATVLSNYLVAQGNGLQYLICKVHPITSKTIIRARDTTDGGANIYDITQSYYSPDFYFIVDFNIGSIVQPDCDHTLLTRESRYSLGGFLGFTQKRYEVFRSDTYIDYIGDDGLTASYQAVLQSEASYGNGHVNYIFISVDDFNKNFITNTIIASTGNNYIGDNILGRISITESFTTIMVNTASDKIFKQRDYLGPVNLNKFRIKILDKYGNLLDLNNNDISLSLEVTSLYSS
jgi:hypothetical protein